MKNNKPRLILILASVSVFCASTVGAKMPENISVRNLARHSDVIVEGVGVEYRKGADHTVPGYIGDSKQNVELKVGERTALRFQIHKVYRGELAPGDVLTVLSSPMTPRGFPDVVLNQRYILFLKKMKGRDAYTIVDNGKGEFRIFDYDGTDRIKTWFQLPAFRSSEAYPAYDDFVAEITRQVTK